MHFDNQTKKGFTLIELLVVIAIIAILSVIGMTQLARAREKARDSERRIDMSQIQHAFISYYDDHNQHYPLVADVTQDPIIPDHSLTPTEAASGIFATGACLFLHTLIMNLLIPKKAQTDMGIIMSRIVTRLIVLERPVPLITYFILNSK